MCSSVPPAHFHACCIAYSFSSFMWQPFESSGTPSIIKLFWIMFYRFCDNTSCLPHLLPESRKAEEFAPCKHPEFNTTSDIFKNSYYMTFLKISWRVRSTVWDCEILCCAKCKLDGCCTEAIDSWNMKDHQRRCKILSGVFEYLEHSYNYPFNFFVLNMNILHITSFKNLN